MYWTKYSKFDSLRQLCHDKRPMGIQMVCVNCWTIYDYHLIQIDLIHTDHSRTFDYLSVQVHSNISVNIDLSISANYNDRFHGTYVMNAHDKFHKIFMTLHDMS